MKELKFKQIAVAATESLGEVLYGLAEDGRVYEWKYNHTDECEGWMPVNMKAVG